MLPIRFTHRGPAGVALKLFQPFGNFTREFDRFFDGGTEDTCDSFGLSIDFREDDNQYLVIADVPGLKKDDIEITIEDGVLTLRGEKKVESETDDANYHVRERQYGSFSRSFRLPTAVKDESVQANLADGVLTITIAKVDEVKARRIDVKTE